MERGVKGTYVLQINHFALLIFIRLGITKANIRPEVNNFRFFLFIKSLAFFALT